MPKFELGINSTQFSVLKTDAGSPNIFRVQIRVQIKVQVGVGLKLNVKKNSELNNHSILQVHMVCSVGPLIRQIVCYLAHQYQRHQVAECQKMPKAKSITSLHTFAP